MNHLIKQTRNLPYYKQRVICILCDIIYMYIHSSCMLTDLLFWLLSFFYLNLFKGSVPKIGKNRGSFGERVPSVTDL